MYSHTCTYNCMYMYVYTYIYIYRERERDSYTYIQFNEARVTRQGVPEREHISLVCYGTMLYHTIL